jgi:hypothetical protein
MQYSGHQRVLIILQEKGSRPNILSCYSHAFLFVKSHMDPLTRLANNLGLMLLRMPIAPVLEPLILLNDPNHCRGAG